MTVIHLGQVDTCVTMHSLDNTHSVSASLHQCMKSLISINVLVVSAHYVPTVTSIQCMSFVECHLQWAVTSTLSFALS